MRFVLTAQERIFTPRLLQECHASTLVRLPDGKYLAAWFAGTKEGQSDVAIYGAIRHTNGTWTTPAIWARVWNAPHWNPVLFRDPAGPVLLFFKVGPACDGRWATWLRRSNDQGDTWNEPEMLVWGDVGGRGPAKNKPIILSDGSWLAAGSREDGGRWRAFTDRSRDAGRTWEASPEVAMDRNIITGAGVIQPTLWESSPGHVHMLVRSSCQRICRSDSTDHGVTWSPLVLTDLPNNNSGIDLAQAADGSLLLACNKVPGNYQPRTPLNLCLSVDNGSTWQDVHSLETGPGEYSYPAVVATSNGFAGTYTWNRESIVFWEGHLEE